MDNGQEWISVNDFAKKLGTSPDQVRRLCAAGRLEAVDVGSGKQRSWRIHRDSVNALKPASRAPGKSNPLGSTPFLDKYRSK